MLLALALLGLGSTFTTAAPAQADDDTELAVNGDFTAGTEGWRTNGPTQSLNIITDEGHPVAELTTDTRETVALNDRINTVSDTGPTGQEYVLTARVRTTTPIVNGALRVREVTENGATSHQTSFWLPHTDWQTVQLSITTTRANSWLDVNLVAWHLQTGQNLRVDHVSIKHTGSAPTPRPIPEPTPPGPSQEQSPAPEQEPVQEPTPVPETETDTDSTTKTWPAPESAPEPAPQPQPDPDAVPGNVPGSTGDTCTGQLPDSTEFGASVYTVGLTTGEAIAELDEAFGHVPALRVFSQGMPRAWDDGQAEHLLGRTLVTSFRAHPSEINAGQHDAYLRHWFANAPDNQVIYWSYFHEPESQIRDGVFTEQEYKHAWTRIAQIADEACKPNMFSTLILTGWTAQPEAGRSLSTYDAGPDVVDVVAFDPYNGVYELDRAYYISAEEKLGPIVEMMQVEGGDRPWGIAELGSRVIPGDDGTGRAAWLMEMGEYIIANNGVFVTYFQSTRDGNWRLDDEPSREAWRELISTS